MLHDIIIKYGIPSYFESIQTDIPTGAGQLNIPIAAILPTQIGRIYGISTYVQMTGATKTADNKTLITVAQAGLLFLNLKWGATNFIQNLRMSELISEPAGLNAVATPISNDNGVNYLPVNIPWDFSLDQSSYINPSLINSGTICLNLWYISKQTYETMIKENIVGINGKFVGKNTKR